MTTFLVKCLSSQNRDEAGTMKTIVDTCYGFGWRTGGGDTMSLSSREMRTGSFVIQRQGLIDLENGWIQCRPQCMLSSVVR
ncbi:hypothetical protein SADUNF_Sadunf01G0133700 [Salix dunnii]|uniref:Uncharacterized protein n=1 Tax=Salix dunnii TaxID=1413687 RepID=A0A835TLG8_9ROSI|nr:hypothetical protein SADUNF_Sadunf01G0133700 [Salix dunnii]